MTFNILTLVIVVVCQYVLGAIWYSFIFKDQWLDINHPEGRPSKEEMAVMGKDAMPLYGYQLIVTIIQALATWYFVSMNYNNWLTTSLVLWAGIITTTVIISLMWSDPKNKQKLLHIGIVASNLLLNAIFAGWMFATFR
jgi:hypothetical protein